jgi:adenosine deaminase
MTLVEVMQAELRGLARGERDFGVVARVINCSLRHYEPAVSVEIAECSVGFRDQGVVAFDLAGGEAGRPPGNHRAAFDIAAQGLLGVTVHAGEAAGAESIADAVHLCHADRIGHGTRLYESPQLRDYIRDRRILIEANITSNVQTRAVRRASEHPVRAYFDAGLNVTLCTDGWLMAGVSLSDEYWLAHTDLGFTRGEIDQLILNGFAGAFLPWPTRLELLSRVRAELADIR